VALWYLTFGKRPLLWKTRMETESLLAACKRCRPARQKLHELKFVLQPLRDD